MGLLKVSFWLTLLKVVKLKVGFLVNFLDKFVKVKCLDLALAHEQAIIEGCMILQKKARSLCLILNAIKLKFCTFMPTLKKKNQQF